MLCSNSQYGFSLKVPGHPGRFQRHSHAWILGFDGNFPVFAASVYPLY